MNSVLSLNLIHFLDFYFALMFFVGTIRRLGQYHSVAKLIISGPQRWPKLLKLVSEYRTIFWTWSMILPALLGLGLWVLQMLVSRLVFPDAGSEEHALTVGRLIEYWPTLFYLVPLGLAMVGFDGYSYYVVGQIDREMLETYFDQAEYWLRSKSAHIVRVVSFGYINPRRMVAEEVEKALVQVGDMLNFTLWWVSVQIGLRFAFALALWITWGGDDLKPLRFVAYHSDGVVWTQQSHHWNGMPQRRREHEAANDRSEYNEETKSRRSTVPRT